MRALVLLAPLLLLGGCGLFPAHNDSELYDAPWPDERLRRDDGTVDVSAFPLGTQVPLRFQVIEGLEGARGFGLSSAIYVPLAMDLDPSSLPSLEQSTDPGSSVSLIDVDRASPELGRRVPIDVRFTPETTPFAPARILSLLPQQGAPLRPETLYAAVVTARVRTSDGEPLHASERVTRIVRGRSDASLHAISSYDEALARLHELGVAASELAELAVFRTGPDPALELRRAVAQALGDHLPAAGHAELIEEHPDYCVFETRLRMPVYQEGRPPYLFEGGAWARRADGELALQREEDARMFVTVPRSPSEGPYPTAVLVRAGAGGDRPLIDRGVRDRAGQSAPGTGLAVHLAHAGFAGVSVDGPLGGIRNIAAWDEQFATFNFLNLAALRDNVRQSALELVLVAHALDALELDASACRGASARVRLDASHLALIGHSMGATIAPLAAAAEPRFRALILSGAGASWIRQIIYKRSPFATRGMAELMLGYSLQARTLSEHDPMLSLLNWAGEAADPQSYGRALAEGSPPDVLVFQGLLDTYIPPPIANPLNLALGLDLGGVELDEGYAEYRSYASDAALGGHEVLALPVQGNTPSGATRVLAQHPEDGIEDGHEVLFQQVGAQRQLRCFLESFARGTPIVVEPGDPLAPCAW